MARVAVKAASAGQPLENYTEALEALEDALGFLLVVRDAGHGDSDLVPGAADLLASLLGEGQGPTEALLAVRLLSCLGADQGLQQQLGRAIDSFRRLAKDRRAFEVIEEQHQEGGLSDDDYAGLLAGTCLLRWDYRSCLPSRTCLSLCLPGWHSSSTALYTALYEMNGDSAGRVAGLRIPPSMPAAAYRDATGAGARGLLRDNGLAASSDGQAAGGAPRGHRGSGRGCRRDQGRGRPPQPVDRGHRRGQLAGDSFVKLLSLWSSPSAMYSCGRSSRGSRYFSLKTDYFAP